MTQELNENTFIRFKYLPGLAKLDCGRGWLVNVIPNLKSMLTLFLGIAKQRTLLERRSAFLKGVTVADYSPKAPLADIARAGLLPITYLAPDGFNVARDFLVFDNAHPAKTNSLV